jgi:hypothetical protein
MNISVVRPLVDRFYELKDVSISMCPSFLSNRFTSTLLVLEKRDVLYVELFLMLLVN